MRLFTQYEIAVALWGEGWTRLLWAQIRDLPKQALIDVLPRYVSAFNPEGAEYAKDVNAGYREALLSRLAEQAAEASQ